MPLSAALKLTLTLTRREIEQRYKGSFGGVAWYVVQMLLLVAIYSLVFGAIFNARWAEGGREPTSFTLALFLGLLFFNLFSECMQRAPTLILGNVNYVKKVVFPLEILPMVTLAAALCNMAIGFEVFFATAALLQASVSWVSILLLGLDPATRHRRALRHARSRRHVVSGLTRHLSGGCPELC